MGVLGRMAVIFVAVILLAAPAASKRSRRGPQRSEAKDTYDLEDYKKRDPEDDRASRLEKYDRLLEMAQKAKADVPRMREQIAELKSREEAILDQDQVIRPPKPPQFGFDRDEDELDYIGSSLEGLDGVFSRLKDEQKPPRNTPMEKEKRDEMMRKSRERLERMRNMDAEERIAEMRRERDERLAERAKQPDTPERDDAVKDLESLMGARKRVWRSKSGDYGPPQPRNLGLEKLTTEERHAKLLEHQKLMEDHRSKMDEWREKHEAYMSERRAIMDSYRDLSHQIREAVFASKPLR